MSKIYHPVPTGAESYLLSQLAKNEKAPLLFIARNEAHMEQVATMLRFFLPAHRVHTFPAWDCLPYDRVSPHPHITSARLKTLVEIGSSQERLVVVTTCNAMLQRIVPWVVLSKAVRKLSIGQTIERDTLAQLFAHQGYRHVANAADPGEFALRGSVVDFVMPGREEGIRIDLWGNEIESMRAYDPLTQLTREPIAEATIIPASEVLLTEETSERFKSGYRRQFGTVLSRDPLFESIAAKRMYVGMEHWLPLFYEKLSTLVEMMPDATLIADDHTHTILSERLAQIQEYYDHRVAARSMRGLQEDPYHPIPPEQLYLTQAEWDAACARHKQIQFSMFDEGKVERNATGYHALPALTSEAKLRQIHPVEILKEMIAKEPTKHVVLTAFSEGSKTRLSGILAHHQLTPSEMSEWKEKTGPGTRNKCDVVILPLEHGFIAPNVTFISEQDLLGERLSHAAKRSTSIERLLQEVASLDKGDLIVHKQHGIGRFEGLEAVNVQGALHECLKLVYANEDKLFVPVENSEVVTRYGSEDQLVPLDKLGGVAWQERKAKLKERIKLAAAELLQVAAARQLQGAPIAEVSPSYAEFCARFPYAETEDQLRAIADVESDLAKGTAMDRLICGDVGFGKTEVALRAAYLVANPEQTERLQVAVIAPTTLLARQHAQTFAERFEGMPVRVGSLSRLVTAKNVRETKQGLADGDVDIVVGTHMLLANDIQFKRLGLVIVDEEQRFGVKQKEALKRLKANCHVLTLTATPIPRTLQLALSGIRDLSIIASPPVDRLAVRTFVMPFDAVVLREAILREYYRGGQVFYVAPRISDLAELETLLKQLVPEIRIIVAHGQMPAATLDQIMEDFVERKYDLLLSTTIIESGIDIPTANTMIMHRSDMYGLAQLYQLRGRVGRSKVRAYAYLTVPSRMMLTKQAEKRLEVMQTLDALGAGFTLASHDMDIRGSGNLLGEEQSGHIKEVGVELYQQMLEDAVAQLRSEKLGEKTDARDFSPQINLGMSVYIPEAFVPDLSVRLGLYQRIAKLGSEAECESVAAEMVDRFGALPLEVENLLTVVKLKQLCKSAYVEKCDMGPKGAMIGFYRDAFPKPEALLTLIMKRPTQLKLRGDQKLVLFYPEETPVEKRLVLIRSIIQEFTSLLD